MKEYMVSTDTLFEAAMSTLGNAQDGPDLVARSAAVGIVFRNIAEVIKKQQVAFDIEEFGTTLQTKAAEFLANGLH